MITISTADLELDFDRHIEAASREPVLVTDAGGDLVMIPVAAFRRLKELNGEASGDIEADETGPI